MTVKKKRRKIFTLIIKKNIIETSFKNLSIGTSFTTSFFAEFFVILRHLKGEVLLHLSRSVRHFTVPVYVFSQEVQTILNDQGLMQQIHQVSQTIQKNNQYSAEISNQERRRILEQQQAEFDQQIAQVRVLIA